MANQATKAKRVEALPRKPALARAEVVDKATRARFEDELDAALKRKPASEVKLAGALRAVATISPGLRGALVEAAETMVRRRSFAREIYGACIRTLAEADDRHVAALLRAALAADDAGGSATLSASCFCRDASLAAPLAKLAASRQSHLAFGAETARVCRGESNGQHLAAVAPMIKESHRIALCSEIFVPLARSAPVPVHVAPALAVLPGAERHLGRWLVLAEVATKAGDRGPLEEATQKSVVGPPSARAAWSLVTWALESVGRAGAAPSDAKPMSGVRAEAGGTRGVRPEALEPPSTRPTVELVARLSDRPSADRDTTFLFRMARARAPSCKPMLEGLVKTLPLADEIAVRAASYLARDHGRSDMKDALLECALNAKRDELRGLAVAALWDAGPASPSEQSKVQELTDELVTASRSISSVAWGALVRAAHTRFARGAPQTHLHTGVQTDDLDVVVAAETPFRWIQWGWLE